MVNVIMVNGVQAVKVLFFLFKLLLIFIFSRLKKMGILHAVGCGGRVLAALVFHITLFTPCECLCLIAV